MGLDMYLHAEKYVSGYSHRDEEDQSSYHRLVEEFGVAEYVDPDTPSADVSFTVGYWRKANHIHQWFVDNVQGGEDECKPHYVSREQLKELREACLRVLALPTQDTEVVHDVIQQGGRLTQEKAVAKIIADPGAAEEYLPTQAGFFFGGTEYGEWYRKDTEETVSIIDRALSMPDEWSFEYHSSW